MITLDKTGNYIPWVQPQYGFDANDVVVKPPKEYRILSQGEVLKQGDIPFDVYSGWLLFQKKISKFHNISIKPEVLDVGQLTQDYYER